MTPSLSLSSSLIAFIFFLLSSSNLEAQIGRLDLSPLQKIEQNIARTDITVVYSRPSARGRKVMDGLVKYNRYWRTGANQNTTISFSQDVVIGEKRVQAGTYAIMTYPTDKMWKFLLYADTDNWDVPDTIQEDKIMAQAEVEAKSLAQHVENLTISIDNFDNYSFDLTIRWEKTQVSVPIKLTTHELMDKIIQDQLAGPDYGDYYLAATYEFESGKNYSRGLAWINQAMTLTDEIAWWDYRIKAYLLLGLEEKEEAKAIAEKGMELAKQAGSEFAIQSFSSILKQVE